MPALTDKPAPHTLHQTPQKWVHQAEASSLCPQIHKPDLPQSGAAKCKHAAMECEDNGQASIDQLPGM